MKRAAILLVFALTTTPALAQTKLDVAYTQFRLPNGLTVILHEDHSVPLVTAAAMSESLRTAANGVTGRPWSARNAFSRMRC